MRIRDRREFVTRQEYIATSVIRKYLIFKLRVSVNEQSFVIREQTSKIYIDEKLFKCLLLKSNKKIIIEKNVLGSRVSL